MNLIQKRKNAITCIIVTIIDVQRESHGSDLSQFDNLISVNHDVKSC